jgi:CRP-like cAMP-binding protein
MNAGGDAALHDAGVGADQIRRRLSSLLSSDGPRIGLRPQSIAIFARRARLSFCRRGQTLLGGDEAVHVLVTGAAKLIVCAPGGTRPLTVGFVRPGRFLGLSSLFDPPRPRLFRAQALTDCWVAGLGHDGMTEIVSNLTAEATYELAAHSWRIMSSILHRKCRSLSSPLRERLVAELQALAIDFGAPHALGCVIDLELTDRELAEVAAASVSRTARTLTQLERDGVVARDGSRLVLLAAPDPDSADATMTYETPVVDGGDDEEDERWLL